MNNTYMGDPIPENVFGTDVTSKYLYVNPPVKAKELALETALRYQTSEYYDDADQGKTLIMLAEEIYQWLTKVDKSNE